MTIQELERRLENLEREVRALQQDAHQRPLRKDWRRTIGAFSNDPEFEEIVRLGAAYRQPERDNPEKC